MNSQNKKTLQIVLLVLIAVLTIGIGYASISAINLIINGNATASVNDNNFKVYFVNTADTPSLTGNVTVSGNARINTGDNTKAEFDVSGLTKVGDYAIATYTILNNSNSIGADITLYITNSNPEYFKVTETVTDSKLQAGDTTTGSIKVELIKTPLNNDASTSVTGTLKADAIENESATGLVPKSKASDDPESFATDSWATIQTAVRNNNTSAYNVGDTKTVTINNTNYTVRLVNKTTGEHCGDNDTAYSQTSCGFVVEFVDIVEQRAMNSTSTNVGGWPGSELYTYLQGTFYNSLPSELKSAIKPTRVISGYSCIQSSYSTGECLQYDNNGNNYVTNDKLFLLSAKEVNQNDYDISSDASKILDYYVDMPTELRCDGHCTAYPKLIKQYQGEDNSWWTRSNVLSCNNCFILVGPNGGTGVNGANSAETGISPAFRIG